MKFHQTRMGQRFRQSWVRLYRWFGSSLWNLVWLLPFSVQLILVSGSLISCFSLENIMLFDMFRKRYLPDEVASLLLRKYGYEWGVLVLGPIVFWGIMSFKTILGVFLQAFFFFFSQLVLRETLVTLVLFFVLLFTTLTAIRRRLICLYVFPTSNDWWFLLRIQLLAISRAFFFTIFDLTILIGNGFQIITLASNEAAREFIHG